MYICIYRFNPNMAGDVVIRQIRNYSPRFSTPAFFCLFFRPALRVANPLSTRTGPRRASARCSRSAGCSRRRARGRSEMLATFSASDPL